VLKVSVRRGGPIPFALLEAAVALHRRRGSSLRSTEAALRERGLQIRHETLRRWARRVPEPDAGASSASWRVRCTPVVAGNDTYYLWIAVDLSGAILDFFIQSRCNKRKAELRLARLLAETARAAPLTRTLESVALGGLAFAAGGA
jgi:putative transposase